MVVVSMLEIYSSLYKKTMKNIKIKITPNDYWVLCVIAWFYLGFGLVLFV